MIPIVTLMYELDMKLNNLSSNKHQEIETPNKIIALNQAQIQYVKKRHGKNNIYQNSFDTGIKRYEDLEFLVVPHKEFDLIEADFAKEYSPYYVNLDKDIDDYFLYVDSYSLAKKGSCDNHPVVNRVIKHSDLPVFYKNTQYKPSFEYQEALATISDKKFIVYTDNTFSLNKLYLSYIRYPVKVDFQGYIHFNGQVSYNVDSEFPLSAKDEILNLAVLELSLDTTNQNQIPVNQQRFAVEE